eukprot:CAMPEP_0184089072 /NCGR_PEP_ID=MMETSP0974-20121125/6543_1 /TAXON_ID=483370 /ORGANISM="non described non described, Strain CCMP2097" /LENGTH=40 /DNA_ID= /DNA_START= /DNA_END= /DNA_ORIENTATION=
MRFRTTSKCDVNHASVRGLTAAAADQRSPERLGRNRRAAA